MDHKKISLLTLCDLSKAFDSVDHSILLNKCLKLRIDPFWFDNYLGNRSQSVRIDNSISNKQPTDYGVPQGSILGPILFNIFVNDLSENVKDCLVVQYDDDTQFLYTGNVRELDCLILKTEDTLTSIERYFLSNGLMLNASKTQCIFIGSRQLLSHVPSNTVIKIHGETITPSNYVKNLGVCIDQFMLFDKHANELSKKVVGTLMFINRISSNLDKSSRIIVVQSLVLSIINYCIQIWGTTNQTIMKKVQKLQNFAARVAIGGAKKYDHVTPIIQELGWIKVKDKHRMDICTTVFKVLNEFYPVWYKKFPTINESTNRVTRQQQCLYVPKTRTDAGARSLNVIGPKSWNNLPNNITDAVTLSSFKGRLIKLHLNNVSTT